MERTVITVINYDRLKPNKIYLRQRVSFNKASNNESFPNNVAFILCGPTVEKNIEIINSLFINPNYAKAFSSLYTYKIKGKSYRFMNTKLYQRIKLETHINKCSNNIASFNGKSFFFDISSYLTNIYNVYERFSYQQKRKLVFDNIIQMIQSKTKGYDKVIFLFNIDGANIEFKDSIRYNQTNLLNSIISAYRFPLNDESNPLPDNFDILWINPLNKSLSLVNKNDLGLKNPSRLKRIVSIMSKKSISNDDMNDTDLVDNGDTVEAISKPSSLTGTGSNNLTIDNDFIASPVMKSASLKGSIITPPVKSKLSSDAAKADNMALSTFTLKADDSSDSFNTTIDEPLFNPTNDEESRENNENEIEINDDQSDDNGVINLDENDDEETTEEDDDFNYGDLDTSELDSMREVDKGIAINNEKRAKQIKRLRDKADSIKIDGMDKTLKEILDEPEPKEFKPREVKQLKTLNETNKQSATASLSTVYMEELYMKDQMEVLNAFSDEDKTIPVFISKITREDSSDSFNKKETLTITFQDVNNVKHNFTVDVPKLIDDRYMFINNSKKVINKQLISLPVVKTGINRVQVTTNYNKTLLERFGSKITSKVEKFVKFISAIRSDKAFKITFGRNISEDTTLKSYIEYDTIGLTLTSLEFKGYNFIFDRMRLVEENKKNKKDELCIGFDPKKNLININSTTGFIVGSNNVHFIDYIVNLMGESYKELFNKTKAPSKFSYTRCSILGRKISLFLILAFKIGITKLLKLMNIKDYGFSEKHPRYTLKETIDDYTVYKFKDGYFYFNSYPISNSLLLNGINEINYEELNFSQLDEFDTYLNIFEDLFDSKAIIKGFDNFVELMLDPITKNICKDLGLPTDFYRLMIYANSLLDDNHKLRENDMSQYRIRSNEIINAYLYQIVAKAYADYKNSYTNNNPQKISVPKNTLIKAIQEDKLVENYSTLNPIKEADALSTFTWRGLQGLNLDEGFKLDKRAFDDTMLGISGLSSPYNRNVGVSRQLAVNPSVKSPRGYLESGSPDNKYSEEQTMTFSEILNPFVTTHDDAPRIAMGFQQSGHMIPGIKNDPALVTYGMDRALPYYLSDDFIAKAKDDGVITDITDDFMFIEYKNGKKEVINIGTDIQANGGGGFYMDIQKTTTFKKGDKIKKDDILSSNNFYFKDCGFGTQYLTGTLTKIAIIPGYFNYGATRSIVKSYGTNIAIYI